MQPDHGPTIDAAVRTHVGHVRQRNEDCAVLGTTVVQADEEAVARSGERAPLLVAALDGLGGHPDGDVASRVAGRELAGTTDPGDVGAAVVAAHEAVLTAVEEGRGASRMGTTVTVAAVLADEVVVGSVGDSSILLVSDTALEQLTEVDRAAFGGLTAFAGDPAAGGVTPHVRHLPLEQELRLVLATDGLTDEVSRPEVHRLAHAGDDAEATAAALVEAALAAGGRDNVTVVVLDVRPRATAGSA